MGTKGFLTQCEGGCGRTTRLAKPGKWRCPSCEYPKRRVRRSDEVTEPIFVLPNGWGILP